MTTRHSCSCGVRAEDSAPAKHVDWGGNKAAGRQLRCPRRLLVGHQSCRLRQFHPDRNGYKRSYSQHEKEWSYEVFVSSLQKMTHFRPPEFTLLNGRLWEYHVMEIHNFVTRSQSSYDLPMLNALQWITCCRSSARHTSTSQHVDRGRHEDSCQGLACTRKSVVGH